MASRMHVAAIECLGELIRVAVFRFGLLDAGRNGFAFVTSLFQNSVCRCDKAILLGV